jgi:histidyl-tRNA synthetase
MTQRFDSVERIQSLRGMRDVLPGEMAHITRVERVARAIMDGYAYEELRLPLLEAYGLFARSAGDTSDIVEKQMYAFADRDGDKVTLRPEGTAGCVRALIENGLIRTPQRVWYAGAMFRHERPQKGRYREFFQIGAEAFGHAGPDIDAELIDMMAQAWQRLGIAQWVTLELNSIGDAEDRAAFRGALVDYLRQHVDALDEDSRRRLERNPLRILDSKDESTRRVVEGAPRLGDYLGPAARAHFDGLRALLDGLGIAYQVNDRLVRGLDYYNRTVFEWTTDRLGAQGTICAGGRYDGLVSQLGGPPTVAAGYALGVDRVALLVEQVEQQAAHRPADAYLMVVVEEGEALVQATARAMRLATELRTRLPGLRIRQHQGGGKMKAQIRKADASGALVALILGEDELRDGTLSLKWLREDRPQERLPMDAVAERLRSLAGADGTHPHA